MQRIRDDQGAEVLEFGLVTGFILLPLLFGLFSAGRAYSEYETISRAAREGARVAVVNTCAACGNATATVSSVETAVLDTLKAASINTANISIPTGCSGNLSSKICYQRDVTLNSGDNPTELGAVVSFTYPVPLSIPFTSIKAANIKITPSVQMREEN
jgi:Flp pilus assembly protein TadG